LRNQRTPSPRGAAQLADAGTGRGYADSVAIFVEATSLVGKVRDYLFLSRRLREYGGWKTQWRPVAGLLIALGLLLLPIVGGVASVYLGQSHDLVSATAGVCVALALAWVSSRLAKGAPWDAPVKRGLRLYEQIDNPAGPTLILVREADYDRAERLLRRHKYFAHSGKRIVVPPSDVPHLDTELVVYRSSAVKPQIVDLKASLVALLGEAGLEARVSGEDVVPVRTAA
jgi:hypothetical protein